MYEGLDEREPSKGPLQVRVRFPRMVGPSPMGILESEEKIWTRLEATT